MPADLESVAGVRAPGLLIDDYTPPAQYNVLDRPWHRAAMEAAAKVSTGTPYQDAVDSEWLVSVGKAFPARDGVVAIDSSIERIVGLLEGHGESYETSYSYVVDQTGSVLIHHEERHLERIVDFAYSHGSSRAAVSDQGGIEWCGR